MAALSLTSLRKQLYQVVDRVLETGIPAEIERKGQKLLIVPVGRPRSRLRNLKKRNGIVGDPNELADIEVGEWHELRNLR